MNIMLTLYICTSISLSLSIYFYLPIDWCVCTCVSFYINSLYTGYNFTPNIKLSNLIIWIEQSTSVAPVFRKLNAIVHVVPWISTVWVNIQSNLEQSSTTTKFTGNIYNIKFRYDSLIVYVIMHSLENEMKKTMKPTSRKKTNIICI